MDLESIILCQTEKDKYCYHMWNKKLKQMNVYNKIEADSDTENKRMVTSGKKEEGRSKIEVED